MGKTKTKTRTVEDSPKPPITIRSTNPKILDDNIAKLENAIKASDVSANPSGTAEETLLSTIGIDGKKYDLGPSAENTSYDNTDSGLTATNSQGAIDEVVEKIDSSITVSEVNFTTESIAAGSVLDNAEYTIPEITGKTPVGVVGYRFTGSGYGDKILLQARVNGDKLVYSVKNTSGSAGTASLYVYILCVNSAFIS